MLNHLDLLGEKVRETFEYTAHNSRLAGRRRLGAALRQLALELGERRQARQRVVRCVMTGGPEPDDSLEKN